MRGHATPAGAHGRRRASRATTPRSTGARALRSRGGAPAPGRSGLSRRASRPAWIAPPTATSTTRRSARRWWPMLARIGIKVELHAADPRRVLRQDHAARPQDELLSVGLDAGDRRCAEHARQSRGDAQSGPRARATSTSRGYSNRALDALVARIRVETDPATRACAAAPGAGASCKDDIAYLPLHRQNIVVGGARRRRPGAAGRRHVSRCAIVRHEIGRALLTRPRRSASRRPGGSATRGNCFASMSDEEKRGRIVDSGPCHRPRRRPLASSFASSSSRIVRQSGRSTVRPSASLRLVADPLPHLRAADLGGGGVLHQVIERHAADAAEPGLEIADARH